MAEFKKGDRVVFTKADAWWGRGGLVAKMPEGTLGTYDDAPGDAAPWVRLDTGERVRAWASRLAPAEDHGTGDGSASDICAEPGCNCDLERRFPAPLDPSKFKKGDKVFVKPGEVSRYGWAPEDYMTPLTVSYEQHDGRVAVLAGVLEYSFRPEQLTPALDPAEVKPGDTVTLEKGDRKVTAPVSERTISGYEQGTWFLDGHDDADTPMSFAPSHWTLTAHQPAPEPEPEWKPGTVADIEVGGDMQYRAIRTDDHLWSTESHWSYEDAEVTDVRPLVVIDPAAARQSLEDNGWGAHETADILEHLGLEGSTS